VDAELEASLKNIKLTLVQSMDELWAFKRWLGERRPILGFDTETTGLHRTKDKIRTAQFGDGQSAWTLPYEDWRGAVKEVLRDYEGPTVAHNLKFDAGMLAEDGIEYPWARAHDTMFMLDIIDSLGPKALKPAAGYHIGPMARAGEKTLHTAMMKHAWTWATVPIDFTPYWAYGGLDTSICAILAEKLWPKVQYAREAYDLEMACSRVICGIEGHGARIDTDYIREKSVVLEAETAELLDALGINPNASGQIIAHLMEQGATFVKRTDKGNLSTDDDVLSELEEQGFADAGLIRRAKANSKVVGTYFGNWLRMVDSEGFLHPSINQTGAKRTGRMTVTNPALQTLHKTKLVRRAFIPRDGHKLVFIDYDNEEVRVAAHFSGDEAIIQAFADGLDLHSETAKRIFGTEGCSHDAALKCKHRATGKTGFLGKLYGSGVDTFADTVGLPREQAAQIHRQLDLMYPGLARTMVKITRLVQQRGKESGGNGWVTTIDGRRISVPPDKGYKGINALIQASCSSVLKRAIVDLDLAGYGDYIILPIHDELGFDVPGENVDEIAQDLARIMTRDDFRVPLTCSPDIVNDWGELYK
jgi:DNA polymerase I